MNGRPQVSAPPKPFAHDPQAHTVFALLTARAVASPDVDALWSLNEQSLWQAITWREFHQAVNAASGGLRALGLRRGDRVAIIAPSSPWWDIAQFAAMAVGAIVVGFDPHDTNERVDRMASLCQLNAVIAQDEALLAKLGPTAREGLRFAVTFMPPKMAGVVSFESLAGMQSDAAGMAPPLASDPALIVFTSGTTGEPKGIVYTNEQVCEAVSAILEAFSGIGPGSRLACWLPLSNLFQRMINFCAVGRGAQVFYVQDPRDIMRHVATIAPHLFIGVPRFYEKLYAGMIEALDAKPGWQRALAHWAFGVGERRAKASRSGTALGTLDRLRSGLAEQLVLRRIRSVLGKNMRYLISGSAPMPLWLLERFHSMGFLVLEAYGMSESIVPVAVNRPDAYRLGTVGKALPTSELHLAVDGELMLRGPGVFTGYLGETGSSERFDASGFLATGDFASIDGDGYVRLLGRKSEIFKTSTGRRIAPASTENLLRQLAYAEHAVVFGANRPFLVAVIAISESALRKRLGDHAPGADLESTAAAVRADIATAVAELTSYQRPAGVILTMLPFSVEGGQVTSNLKIRRANVELAYKQASDELFDAIARNAADRFIRAGEDGTWLSLTT